MIVSPRTIEAERPLAARGSGYPDINYFQPFKTTGERSLSASRVPTIHGCKLRGSMASARHCPIRCAYRASWSSCGLAMLSSVCLHITPGFSHLTPAQRVRYSCLVGD
jgi:hypothetical protein